MMLIGHGGQKVHAHTMPQKRPALVAHALAAAGDRPVPGAEGKGGTVRGRTGGGHADGHTGMYARGQGVLCSVTDTRPRKREHTQQGARIHGHSHRPAPL